MVIEDRCDISGRAEEDIELEILESMFEIDLTDWGHTYLSAY